MFANIVFVFALIFLQSCTGANQQEQAFSVQLDHNIQNGTIRLLDLQARVIGAWTISGDLLRVREVNVTPGVYLLEVLEEGHVLSRNKLVFSR